MTISLTSVTVPEPFVVAVVTKITSLISISVSLRITSILLVFESCSTVALSSFAIGVSFTETTFTEALKRALLTSLAVAVRLTFNVPLK